MKKYVFTFLVLLSLGTTVSCEPDDQQNRIPTYATGDEADDPAEPDDDD